MIPASHAVLLLLRNAGVVGGENAVYPAYGSAVGTLPSGPSISDNYVAVRRSGALVEDGKLQKTGEPVEFPYVQVMVRARTHLEAERKGKAVVDLLCKSVARTVITSGSDSCMVHSVKLVTGLTYVAQQEKNQTQLYSINFQVTISEV